MSDQTRKIRQPGGPKTGSSSSRTETNLKTGASSGSRSSGFVRKPVSTFRSDALATISDMVQEIISVIERRRRLSTEERTRILEKASRSDVVIASVLAGHQRRPVLSLAQAGTRGRDARAPHAPLNAELRSSFLFLHRIYPKSAYTFRSDALGVSVRRMRRPLLRRHDRVVCKTISHCPRRANKVSVEITLANGWSLTVDEAVEPAVLKRLIAAMDG